MKPIAYSYIRFSSVKQWGGDSVRRQTQAAADWCKRNGVELDTSLKLHDLGKSAFKGKHADKANADRFALAAFRKAVELGKVAEGSYLIVESLDRLTREHILPAFTLLLNLMQEGVRVVQLHPVETVYDKTVDPMKLMMALMELARANSESEMKSNRARAAWNANLKQVRDRTPGVVRTGRIPSWLEVAADPATGGERLVVVSERADAVRRVFELAATGYGHTLIVRKLNKEKIPALGDREFFLRSTSEESPTVESVPPALSESELAAALADPELKDRVKSRAKAGTPLGAGRWTRTYVGQLLVDRRVLGELQSYSSDRETGKWVPNGEPIPDFYPRIVSDKLFSKARLGAEERQEKTGRRSEDFVNVFPKLLWDATTQGVAYIVVRSEQTGHRARFRRVVISAAANEQLAPAVTYSADAFEWAILSQLAELNPQDVLSSAADAEQDPVKEIEHELAVIVSELTKAKANLDEHGFSDLLAAHIRKLEDKEADIRARLESARAEASAGPLSATFAEVRPLVEALRDTPDPTELRMRLRSALRRIVHRIQFVIVPRGRARLAAVEVVFKGGERRSYLIGARSAFANRWTAGEAKWFAHSVSLASGLTIGHWSIAGFGTATEEEVVGLESAQVAGFAREELESYPAKLLNEWFDKGYRPGARRPPQSPEDAESEGKAWTKAFDDAK